MAGPLIGLTGRRKAASDVAGFPESLHALPVDLYLAGYAQAIIEAGGIPVHLPLDVPMDAILDRLDGLLLSGGADIDPTRYGESPAGENYGSEPFRDQHELSLITAAADRNVPTLGICRGLQLLNISRGGNLHQDVPEHARYDIAPHTEAHTVTFTRGSRLHQLYGPGTRVNTLHHQTIDRLGEDLTATARAEDGTIEGIEWPGKPLLGVQWHPEMMPGRESDPIFGWLVDQAAH